MRHRSRLSLLLAPALLLLTPAPAGAAEDGYGFPPATPHALDTAPVSTANWMGCGEQPPLSYIGTEDFSLTARVYDADDATLRVRFQLWASGHPYAGLVLDKTITTPGDTTAQLPVAASALDPYRHLSEGEFSWRVRAFDGDTWSAWGPGSGESCRFLYNPDRPQSPPTVTSAVYPPYTGAIPDGTGTSGEPGTFAFGPNGVPDIASYRYTTSWDSSPVTVPADAGGAASVTLTPWPSGVNTVSVQSVDADGNASDLTAYDFWVRPPEAPLTYGDINRDGHSDIWGVAADGTLTGHHGAADGTLAPAPAPASAEDFDGALLAHRGGWTGGRGEDLIAALPTDEVPGGYELWIYPNRGDGVVCGPCGDLTARELIAYDERNDRWSEEGIKQITGIAEATGPFPGLLLNNGTSLWLYYGNGQPAVDDAATPTQLAGPGDPLIPGVPVAHTTLLAPGDWNDDGIPDLLARDDRPSHGGLYLINGSHTDSNTWTPTTPTQLTPTGWDSTTAPHLAGSPSHTGNGLLTFWTTTPTGTLDHVTLNPTTGTTTRTPAATGFTDYQQIS